MKRIGEVCDADRRSDIRFGEARNDARRPSAVTLGHAPERRVRVFPTPPLRIEIAFAEIAEVGRARRALGPLPGPLNRAYRRKILENIAEVHEIGVPEGPRNGIRGPLAPKAITEIDVPMSHVAGARPIIGL